MAQHNSGTMSPRIGKYKGEILAHAIPQEIIGRVGVSMKKSIPKNASETVSYRRYLPKGATVNSPNTWNLDVAAHRLSEGETPQGDVLEAQNIEVSLAEYGVLYRFSNRVAETYEDDIPKEMRRMTGERMGLLLELIRWGQLRAGTNVFYPKVSITSRSSIGASTSEGINGSMLRRIARSLSNNLAMKPQGVLSASPNTGTQPIEAAFVVVCSSDLEADIRANLSGFVHVSEYGQRQVIHPNELGSWEQFRFITSPHLGPYLAQGSSTQNASTQTYLTNGTNGAGAADVYPFVVMGEECYGDVTLRGMDSMKVVAIPASVETKDDPLGQRGVIGARTYFTAVRLNEGHMAVGEVAASILA